MFLKVWVRIEDFAVLFTFVKFLFSANNCLAIIHHS
jgi:hypothetical protein